MSWFNWPPDPTPTPPAYFREHKLRARKIDPGVALAERLVHEQRQQAIQESIHESDIRPFSIGWKLSGRNCTIRQLSTTRNESDSTGSANDSGFPWIFSDGRWGVRASD